MKLCRMAAYKPHLVLFLGSHTTLRCNSGWPTRFWELSFGAQPTGTPEQEAAFRTLDYHFVGHNLSLDLGVGPRNGHELDTSLFCRPSRRWADSGKPLRFFGVCLPCREV